MDEANASQGADREVRERNARLNKGPRQKAQIFVGVGAVAMVAFAILARVFWRDPNVADKAGRFMIAVTGVVAGFLVVVSHLVELDRLRRLGTRTEDEPSEPPPTIVDTVPRLVRDGFRALPGKLREWLADPDFSVFFLAFMLFAAALYLRAPSTTGGFVFDEQEAILANPYVRGKQPWLFGDKIKGPLGALQRDFWGLLPDRSIGSYRPIPNLLWRALWRLQEWRSKGAGGVNTPFVWFNLVFHATNAALLATIVRGVMKRVGVAWLAGFVFVTCAVLTEAITGIVGVADVLGALSLLLCLAALSLPPAFMGPAVFGATVFGLLSKETAIVNVGLVPLAAFMLAPSIDAENPRRWERAAVSLAATVAAFGLYAWIRHNYFHLVIPLENPPGRLAKLGAELQWYIGAPTLPVDPFNNPLAEPTATNAQRIVGALRVYARGVSQIVLPIHLSPDYSFPQEPLPTLPLRHAPGFLTSVIGAVLLVGPPLVGVALFVVGGPKAKADAKRPSNHLEGAFLRWIRPSRGHSSFRALLGYALIAWPAAFFPISNIPKILPTVRAERFWYTPALATSVVLALGFWWLATRGKKLWYASAVVTLAFLGFQGVRARIHASTFNNDLAFWRSAAAQVPNSAKAHLNYSVMLGARAVDLWGWTAQQAQEARLVENIRAAELAPQWDMAFIYVGDTLCQLNRMDEAWGWYVKGFRIGPANSGLIALALQCLSDHNSLLAHEAEAEALIAEKGMPGSWLAYLVSDTLDRERKCRGVHDPAEDYVFGEDPLPDEPPPEDMESSSAGTGGSASGSAKASGSANASGSAKASSSVSASVGASAKASVSASTSEDPNALGSGSASAEPVASGEPAKKEEPKPLPPCGVDPQYRPRGLDGDPKGE